MSEVDLLKNGFEHSLNVVQDVVVPKANDVIPAFFQRSRSLSVLFRPFAMLTAVNFNDQFSLKRDEIDNESDERDLSFEFDAIELAGAKSRPQQFFGFGRPLTQRAGVPSHRLSPLTLPSPQRGEGHFT